MYWTPAQQLAHLTVNGASLRTGDLFASGTVSGPARDQRGSLLELSWGGAEPLTLADGSTRTFLEDGDVVTITATAPGPDGTRIGFGEVTGTVQPARGGAVGAQTLSSSSGTSCPSAHRTSTATSAPQPLCRSAAGRPAGRPDSGRPTASGRGRPGRGRGPSR